MKRQRNIALMAMPDFTARAALDECGVPSAVEQKNRLLLSLKALPHRIREPFGKDVTVSGGTSLFDSQVDDVHRWQRASFHALGQFQQLELSLLHIVPALERGR